MATETTLSPAGGLTRSYSQRQKRLKGLVWGESMVFFC